MLRNVFLKTLRDQGRSLLWWAIGMVALALFLAFFYPSIRDMADLNKLLGQVPEPLLKSVVGEFTDFTSPEGYLNTQLFFMIAPLLFVVYAVASGSSAIAGEEERGTLDMLLANPLPRWRIVVQKFAAMIVATLAVAAALWLGLALGALAVNMDISLGRVAEATLSAALLRIRLFRTAGIW